VGVVPLTANHLPSSSWFANSLVPTFLLCRQVVELLSTVIEHLVKGEIMQMKPSATGRSALDYYLRKNFYKTASLMGHSCLAAAVLGTCCAASTVFGF
jgi:geranyl diphosphate synthase